MEKHLEALTILAKDLNESNITWGLGGSMLLYFNNYPVTVDDLDIVIDLNDYKKLIKVLKRYDYKYMEPNKLYKTTHFFSLVINSIDIDIMLGFKVVKDDLSYEFPFDKNEIDRTLIISNQIINLCKVSEWLKAYKAMNRIDKVKIIEDKEKATRT